MDKIREAVKLGKEDIKKCTVVVSKEEKEVLDFYKTVYCVDGEVKVLKTIKGFKIDGIVELNDSKRGKFYIATVKGDERK